MSEAAGSAHVEVIGRYALYGEIASGGMASIHYGRLIGPAGFSRTVAIKRLHRQFASDPEFVAMFLDEARLAARIRHPNVIQVLDVAAIDRELVLVMDYVHGESLARILRACQTRGARPPLPIVSAVLIDTLRGLHAAHEARDDRGESLGLVHRDVSPQNVLVGQDGLTRVLDFGIAKAAGRAQNTRDGQLKGKLGYMAPEQLVGTSQTITRRTDIYAAGVVLWEALTLERLYSGDEPASLIARIVTGPPPLPPSSRVPSLPRVLDDIVGRALDRDPEARYATALELAEALEHAVRPASVVEVSRWVGETVGAQLELRNQSLAEIESDSGQKSPNAPTAGASDENAKTVKDGYGPGGVDVDASTIASQVATILPSHGSGRVGWAVAAGLSALLVAAGIFWFARPSPTRTSELPSVAAPAPSSEIARPELSAAPPEPVPALWTSASAVAEPSAAPAAPTKITRSRTRTKCSPPYTIDKEGIRHPKPECL
jgi:eukaryotic-like serine/threonine-protein kinase